MRDLHDWRRVYDFWFPPGQDEADPDSHGRMWLWCMRGGANSELPPFAPVLEAARAGRLDHWPATPLGRPSLIVVLDQFPRGLHAGTPEAYVSDPQALAVAEEGLRNGHYDALTRPWEKTFFGVPLRIIWSDWCASWPARARSLARLPSVSGRITCFPLPKPAPTSR